MNQNKLVSKFALASIAALMTALTPVVNAADPVNVTITKFTLDAAAKPIVTSMDGLGPDANAFYNPGMGHTGWSHSSAWGYVALKKGVPVTIEAACLDENFHPGIAVWQSNGKSPLENAEGTTAAPGSYEPWMDVVINKLPSIVDAKRRSLKMYFVTNGVDRDGWEQAALDEVGSDNSLINRIPDGDAGIVKVRFTPTVSGNYVFVVGGMNPHSSLGASTQVLVHKVVNVSVTQTYPQD